MTSLYRDLLLYSIPFLLFSLFSTREKCDFMDVYFFVFGKTIQIKHVFYIDTSIQTGQ